MVVCKYVWWNKTEFRTKTRILDTIPGDLRFPIWNFDGSSTGMADVSSSEVWLRPVAYFRNKVNYTYIVWCECVSPDGQNVDGLWRSSLASARGAWDRYDFLFGIEQEFFLARHDKRDGLSGAHYCSIRPEMQLPLEIVNEHMTKCLEYSLGYFGNNSEVAPGQWEFQTTPLGPLEVGDHLWVMRYLLVEIAARRGYNVIWDPKPYVYENGSGGHTNFSTRKMLVNKGEYQRVIDSIAKFQVDNPPWKYYGEGNEQRLTGTHETSSVSEFKFGVGDRSASIRIPTETARKGVGYLEDRRPAANADPYGVVYWLVHAIGMSVL